MPTLLCYCGYWNTVSLGGILDAWETLAGAEASSWLFMTNSPACGMSCLFQWSEWSPRVTTQVDPHFQSSAFSAAKRGWFLLLHQMSMCHFDNNGCCRAPTWPGHLPPSVRMGGSWTGQRVHELQVTRGSLRTCQLQESKGSSDDQCHLSRRDETAHGITDPENNLPFFFFFFWRRKRKGFQYL